ncbi:MAG: hypothetical protein R3B67_10160 [Phycisphaerales bacterium]
MKVKIVQVGAWLCIGALVSLIQTWWVIHFYENTIDSALRPALLRYPYTRPYDSWRSSWVVVDHGGEPLLVRVNRNRNGRVFQVRSSLMIQPDPDQSRNRFELPDWSLPARDSADFPGRAEEIVLEQANGWPFIAWKGEYMYDMDAYASRWSWSMPDDWQEGLDAYQHVILFPYRPIFPGVFYNALLYGVGAWLGLRGCRMV